MFDSLLGWVIGLMLSIAAIFGLSYVLSAVPCEAKAKRMGLQHQYGWIEGCMVKADNRWVPLDAYRVVD